MKYTATLISLFFSAAAWAQGYEIKITLKPFKNQYIYLGHYYGKQLPIIDSVKLDANSHGVFKGNKKLGGGIYLIGYPDRAGRFELLIDKNQKFSVIADTARMEAIRFVNSEDNVDFKAYQQFMMVNGMRLDSLYQARRGASEEDSVRISSLIEAQNLRIKNYRNNIITKKPKSLLAVLLRAMTDPEVPRDHPAAKTDSQFAYKYFKSHFWDDVEFFDDRLVRTPFFESRIDRYLEQLVYPSADSVIKELDYILGFASINEEMQKFLLLKFVNRYFNQKYMWEDKVFVHLFEKYFSGKDYPWLNEKGKKAISDRAYSLMANITGTPAADIELNDTSGKKTNLYDVQADYTIVAIWDPMCGHCKEVLPQMDSAYQAKWKSMGVKIFGMARETEGKKTDWLDFIRKNRLNEWTHVYYSKEEDAARVSAGIPGYSQLYDVQSFPTLYLLDKDKNIIAKKVTIDQINEILEYREKR